MCIDFSDELFGFYRPGFTNFRGILKISPEYSEITLISVSPPSYEFGSKDTKKGCGLHLM